MGLAGSKILRLCCPILRLCWSILGLCWPTLALCWPALGPRCADLEAYVGLMLTHVEPKEPKKGNSKKNTVKRRIVDDRRPILGLCWPILELCWPILGLCWPILGPMLAHLEAMLVHLEAYVGPF